MDVRFIGIVLLAAVAVALAIPAHSIQTVDVSCFSYGSRVHVS